MLESLIVIGCAYFLSGMAMLGVLRSPDIDIDKRPVFFIKLSTRKVSIFLLTWPVFLICSTLFSILKCRWEKLGQSIECLFSIGWVLTIIGAAWGLSGVIADSGWFRVVLFLLAIPVGYLVLGALTKKSNFWVE